MPPRVLIFGTGSIGAVYAWILSRAVTEGNVYTVCRSNYIAASTQGFTIHSTIFGNNLTVRPVVVKSTDDAARLTDNTPFDYVVITAKSIPSTPSLPDQIRPAVGPNTTIVLIQNGIGIEDIYRSAYPENPILSCVVYLPATQTSPGVIAHREIEHLHIGTFPSSSSTTTTTTTTAPQSHETAASNFASLLHAGGGSATVHADIQIERWSKLLVNAAWNPVCALSRSRDAQFLHSSPRAPDLVKDIMLEVASIARASGYETIPWDEKVEHQMGRARAREIPGVQPSMQADALAGRRMEVDAIVGNALRIAEERGVRTPLLRLVFGLVKALDERVAEAEQSRRG